MNFQKIGQSIDRVEELGDIGASNMDQICKIISKNRSITDKNVHLLYDVTNTSLCIYDSTST
jgi:DNA repair protein RAD7